MRILHFADAHIDIAAHGRHDPQSGLPVRVQDFLKALDTIVDTAIDEKVDLVLFAGDAYKDRTPVPTFQREWGKRIVRLSQAGIPTVLLVGNHDLSPATGRAHAMQEFETIPVPHVKVISRPMLLTPADLEGLPLQIIGLPWVSRSTLMSVLDTDPEHPDRVYEELEAKLEQLVHLYLAERCDPGIPTLLMAHASVQGAVYGGERAVMLGSDLVLSGSLVRDPRFSYVALGHIHKNQDLNPDQQPPVIYPGSIERVDFGEAADEKYFVIVDIEPGQDTRVEWRRLEGRRFIDRRVKLTVGDGEDSIHHIQEKLFHALPPQAELADAFVRLVIEYPIEMEVLINEQELRRYTEAAFEFHLIRRPQREARQRLPNDQTISSLSALELLGQYWGSLKTADEETNELQKLAREVIAAVSGGGES